MGLHQSLPADILALIRENKLALAVTFVCLSAPLLLYIYRYRASIKKHLKEIEANASISKVIRNKKPAQAALSVWNWILNLLRRIQIGR